MAKDQRLDDDEYDPYWDAGPSMVGSYMPTMEVPKKRRQKIFRRPIGFMANIDELIENDSDY